MKKLTLSVATISLAMMSYGQTTQCEGLTKDSIQCKNKTTQVLCYLHNPNYVKSNNKKSVLCNGITKSGKNCKLKTKNISGYCRHHESQCHNCDEID